MSERTQRLKKQFFENRPSISLEAAHVKTQVFKETETSPIIIRQARAFKRYCETKTLTIQEDELLVGNAGAKARQATITPDLSNNWFIHELDTMSTRSQDPYDITEEQKELYRKEIHPYWIGRTLREYWESQIPTETKELVKIGGVIDCGVKMEACPGEHVPNFRDYLFVRGFSGVKEQAKEALKVIDLTITANFDKRDFWLAAIETCEGLEAFCRRYAEKAKELSVHAKGQRKEDLEKIYAVCLNLSKNPPSTFWEALQMVYVCMCAFLIEGNGGGYSIGRLDQYLLPFYKKDVADGVLDSEKALELLECMWIKLGEQLWYQDEDSSEDYAGYCPFHNICIGGTDVNGQDAVNPLSYMMLDATISIQMAQPSLSVRLSKKNPEAFYMKIAECVQTGSGFPAIHSDDVGVKMIMKKGIPAREARDWAALGCVEPTVPGKMTQWTSAGHYNLASAIEFALTKGVHLKSGKQAGLETADPVTFKDFADFEKVVYAQLENIIRHFSTCVSLFERIHLEHLPTPFASLVTLDCVEKGQTLMQGGARFNSGPGMNMNGIGDFIDSMAAVKSLVYERKSIEMGTLVKAIKANFVGYDEVRRLLCDDAPKWGNDQDEADRFAGELTSFIVELYETMLSVKNTPRVPVILPISSNIPQGKAVSALPSGRLAGTPLADGISPCQGYDRSGPTAVIKSMGKFPHADFDGGTLLNVRFAPQSVHGIDGRKRLAAYFHSALDHDIFHIQFNIVGQNVLRVAQEKPEEYKSLLVRVAGYSAYFVELSHEMQEDIISRMPHEF